MHRKKEDLLQRTFNKKRKERALDASKKVGKRDQIKLISKRVLLMKFFLEVDPRRHRLLSNKQVVKKAVSFKFASIKNLK